jgi:hypothetical protein
VPLTHKFAKQSSLQTHPIHSIGPKTHVLERFGPFRYCTKVDAKLDERSPLTPKFAKRSCVGIFRNERTKSTPLDPKLNVLGRFGLFRYCTKVDAKLAELVPLTPKCAKRRYVGKFRNECTRSTPLDPKLNVVGRFGPFRYCTKVGAKLAELVPLTHKFAKRRYVRKFQQ